MIEDENFRNSEFPITLRMVIRFKKENVGIVYWHLGWEFEKQKNCFYDRNGWEWRKIER